MNYNTILQVLASSSVFISTQPPLISFVPYTMRSCYILALLSFAHALGGLLNGLAVVNVYQGCDREWSRDVSDKLGIASMTFHTMTPQVLTRTRFRLCCTLLFISWPIISLILSILFLIFCERSIFMPKWIWWRSLALVVACYTSGVGWFQLMVIMELLSWVWLPVTFVWCALETTLPRDKRGSLTSDVMKVDEPKQTHICNCCCRMSGQALG